MQNISMAEAHMNINRIRNILKEYVVKGHVVPANLHRPCDCFVCVFGGNAVYNFTEQTVNVTEGDILYIAKGSTYVYDILSETYDYIYLDFELEEAGEAFLTSRVFTMKSEKNTCYHLFERMYKLWLLRNPGYYEQCMSDIYQVCSKLVQSDSAPYVSSASRSLSNRAAMYIAQNCTDKDFQIGKVAVEMSCSDVHLRRVFKRDLGLSPMAYATRIRLDKAKSLLANTQYSIMMISDMTGFKDAYYFSRIFKQVLGCTPTEYRNRK